MSCCHVIGVTHSAEDRFADDPAALFLTRGPRARTWGVLSGELNTVLFRATTNNEGIMFTETNPTP